MIAVECLPSRPPMKNAQGSGTVSRVCTNVVLLYYCMLSLVVLSPIISECSNFKSLTVDTEEDTDEGVEVLIYRSSFSLGSLSSF